MSLKQLRVRHLVQVFVIIGQMAATTLAAIADESQNPLKLHLKTLGTDVEELSLRVRMPALKGTRSTGLPTDQEINSIEGEILRINGEIEKAFEDTLKNSKAKRPEYSELVQLSMAIRSYRNIWIDLIITKLALPETMRSSFDLFAFIEKFNLNLPFELVRLIPQIETDSSNRFGEVGRTLDFDWTHAASAGRVIIKLNLNFVAGLDGSQVFEKRADEDGLFSFVQFFTIRQELEVLQKIRQRLGKGSGQLPEMSKNFSQKFQSLRMWNLLKSETSNTDEEGEFKRLLLNSLAKYTNTHKTFGDQAYFKKLVKISNPESSEEGIDSLANDIKIATDESVTLNLTLTFENLLNTSNLQFSLMPNELVAVVIKERLSRAFNFIYQQKHISELSTLRLFMARPNSTPEEIQKLGIENVGIAKRRLEIKKLIQTLETKYNKDQNTKEIIELIADARKKAKQSIGNETDFSAALFEASRHLREGVDGSSLNISILIESLKSDFESAGIESAHTGVILSEIAKANDYLGAQKVYQEQLKSLSERKYPETITVTEIENAKRLRCLDKNCPFEAGKAYDVADKQATTQNSAKKLSFLKEELRRQLSDLKKVGVILRFNEKLDEYHKSLAPHDILTKYPVAFENYKRIIRDKVIRSQGILALEIEHNGKLRKFYEILEEVKQDPIATKAVIKKGLEEQERRTLASIKECSEATHLGDLETHLKSSMMNTLLMYGFPEFEMPRSKFLHQLSIMEPDEVFVRQHLGRFMAPVQYGMLAAMFVDILKWGFTVGSKNKVVSAGTMFLKPLSVSLWSYTKGFIWPVMGIWAAQIAYDHKDSIAASKETAQVQQLMGTNAEGLREFDLSEYEMYQLNSARLKHEVNKDWVIVGATVLFIPISIVRSLSVAKDEQTFWKAAESFDRLNVSRWNWSRTELDSALGAAKRNHPAGSAELKSAQFAYDTLIGEIQAGRTFDPRVFQAGDFSKLSSWEKKILRILRSTYNNYATKYYMETW